MTTVVDPLGTPTPIYNRSGVAIIPSLTAQGTTSSDAAIIPTVSGHTVVIVSAAGHSGYGVMLPSGADIGDVVELYCANLNGSAASAILAYAPSGETLNSGNSDTVNFIPGQGVMLRKVSSTDWESL